MKINKINILIIILFAVTGIGKSQISDKKLIKAADNFIVKTSVLNGYVPKNNIKKIYSGKELTAYVVNLNPEGYVIFTASEYLYPVFSFSEKGNFNLFEAMQNPIFKTFINNLKKQNDFAEKNKQNFKNIIEKNKKERNQIFNSENKTKTFDYQYGYYLPDTWGGVNCQDIEGNMIFPSNYFTPNHFSPGCVAISAAQILHYYEWPVTGKGSHTDYDTEGSSQGTYYAAFGRTKYDWDNMLDDYQNEYSTDKEQRAIGRLMYHAAVAVDMDFENEGSTSHVNRVPDAFQNYFRCTGHYEISSWINFRNRLKQNLENKMPVEFGIEADNGEKHACVCDGYRYNEGDDENDKLYHLNMGWWNAYGGNAWYHIFDEFSAVGYTTITGGVFDITPEPIMNEVVKTSNTHTFIVNWKVSKNFNWEAFELQESYNNGTWNTLSSDISDTLFVRTVTADGIYKYRVKAKAGGSFFLDSYSNVGVVQVGNIICLDFDGNDSFFVNDNQYNDLDVSDNWTIEAWVKADSYNDGDWSVIADRRNVFSLYLLDDTDADFAVRFAVRDNSDNIIASLRSDNSDINLELGKWFHVAVSFDGTTARLFLNGTEADQSNDTNFNLSPSANALNIGARWWGNYSRYFDGKIDEIKLSDTVRYTQNFCPDRFELAENDDKTRLLLNLQYGTGTALFDASRHFLSVSLRNSPNTPAWFTDQVPVINIQPKNKALCYGNVNFIINADYADNYKWQINNGSGFVDLTDNTDISGTTTNSLQINNVSPFTGNNKIRCLLSNSQTMQSCSDEAVFDVYDNCTVWDGTTWSNGTPDAAKTAVVEANYSADNYITANNLIIEENDTLFVNENITLKILNNFFNNGTLLLKSENPDEIPGTFVHEGSVINEGNMIIQKTFSAPYTNVEDNNFFFSCPIVNTNKISNIFTQQPILSENNGKVNSWKLLNDENINFSDALLYRYDAENKSEAKGTFFSGTRTEYFKKLKNDDYFAFVSNPYPSVICRENQNGWQQNNISSSIYTYDIFNDGNSFNFSVWDGTVGIHSGNGYIKPEESFFVYMTDYRSSLTINNDARISTEDMNTEKSLPDNLIRFRFENENENIFDEAVLYFGDTEKNSIKIIPENDFKFYAYVLSGSEKYAIKKIKNTVTSIDTSISVGFKTSLPADITFKVTDFTFDETLPVQLKDMWTGQTKMLSEGSTYTFSASSAEPDNRFKLLFGNNVTKIKQTKNEIFKVWTNGKIIFIKNLNSENFNYKLFDLTGKIIEEGTSDKDLTLIKKTIKGYNVLMINGKYSEKPEIYRLIVTN